jgi:hypothetical protein
LALVHLFLTKFPLCRASFARWVISLRAAVSSFHGPQFSYIRIFLTSFLFRHANFARRNNFRQAAADLLLDLLSLRVLFILLWRLSAARLQTIRRFFGPPTCINAASSLGISWCSSVDRIIPGEGLHLVASW